MRKQECKQFKAGKCFFGSSCEFLHVEPESAQRKGKQSPQQALPTQKRTPQTGQPQPSPPRSQPESPQAPKCTFYPNCTKPNCKFFHPPSDGTTPVPEPKICSFFQKGKCNRGENCQFLHPSLPQKPLNTKTKICKFFCYGKCLNPICEFLHPDPLISKKCTFSSGLLRPRTGGKKVSEEVEEKFGVVVATTGLVATVSGVCEKDVDDALEYISKYCVSYAILKRSLEVDPLIFKILQEEDYLSSISSRVNTKFNPLNHSIELQGTEDNLDGFEYEFKELLDGKLKLEIKTLMIDPYKLKVYKKVTSKQTSYPILQMIKHSLRVTNQLPNGVVIIIEEDSIFNHLQDVIFSAANEQLQNDNGIALKIEKHAGSKFAKECKNYVSRNGAIGCGNAVLTGAGDLKCQGVIHCVGPRWRGGNHKETETLILTIQNALKVAQLNDFTSVALPAISGGIFGFPAKLCAETISLAILDWLSRNTNSSVKKVVICEKNADILDSLQLFFGRSSQQISSDLSTTFSNIKITDDVIKSTQKKISGQWYWRNDEKSFTPYDADQNIQIELAYQDDMPLLKGITGDKNQIKNGFTYNIDLKVLTQTNTTTGKERDIKREQMAKSFTISESCDLKELNRPVVKALETKATIEVVATGLKDNIKTLFELLEEQFDLEITTKVIPFNKTSDNEIKALLDSATNVSVTYQNNSAALYGLKNDVDYSYSLVLPKLSNTLVQYPPEWTSQAHQLELIDLTSGNEYDKIRTQFLKTLPSAKITKIQRIQNTWLWEKYYYQKLLMEKKNGHKENEKYLFHGTSKTNPKLLYHGQEGFDHKFSGGGMWGLGTYFASSASYSNDYAYLDPSSHKQMFMAVVLTGDWKTLPADKHLKMPPEKPNSTKHAEERYDSVQAITSDSINYVVYDIGRAYPSYLITYR